MLVGTTAGLGKSTAQFRESDANWIDVGLLNNMPDAALEATERQFGALLDTAADGMVIRLTVYGMSDVPRTESGRRRVDNCYADIAELWDRHLDGLIVTGTEPRVPNLTDEPYWGSLTKVLEWAEHNTHSTVWSCLAAHAAVLHIDGIGRRPLSDKRFGVFKYARISDHRLMADTPSRLQMPHSRWNDVPEDTLTACGYRVLTWSADAGIDAFVKQRRKSQFVFFQGHPEYDANTLLLEYRRDIRRFLRRERETYPTMARDYFDKATADALAALQRRALADRSEALLEDLTAVLARARVTNPWRPVAARMYRNWLLELCAEKARRVRARART